MLTSPGLACQAALKMTNVKLDLFTDIDMHLFSEKSIRGGVSMISHRHSEANHSQCPNYDSTKDNKYITYLDVNNLYGRWQYDGEFKKSCKNRHCKYQGKKLKRWLHLLPFTIFDETLVAVPRKLTKLCLNRPIQVGFAIRELSKVLIYDFQYNVILKKYGDKARLLFTDTDSLCYEIATEDLFKDFEDMKQYFDFSDYPLDHPLFSLENKKKRIGFLKDELNGQPCFEYVGLRSKM
ncbi:hypothetical protein AVEN_266971-1 [Araneus ventricosus]|uniref:DNA-directed DNA polymerase n=1 Tax=Araneus ventricosus TaxID=182803 RepID=A0A4Y2HM59_ARAVE|nr:hypothetical protein AVEN_266971-1 [Araneus ventricosus]